MKKIALYSVLITIAATILYGCKTKQALNNVPKTTEYYQNIIEQKNYKFTAKLVHPNRGAVHSLSPGYEVTLAGDTLNVYLPFYGVAYTAPINLSGNTGFDFKSTDFEYKTIKRKSNQYVIKIKPNDISGTYNSGAVLTFVLYDNGSATLNIISNNRESIDYTGTYE